MEFSVPVLVCTNDRQVHEVLLPRIGGRTFKGASLARLLDDVALHLMERIPKSSVEQVARYEFCPYLELRKVKVRAQLPPEGREEKFWEGRVSVLLERWPEDTFWMATVPRLGPQSVAVDSPGHADIAAARLIEGVLKDGAVALDDLVCRSHERLEILSVDADLPTILPSHPLPRKSKQKKKTKSEAEPKKRVLVSPSTLSEVGTDLVHRALDQKLRPAFGRDVLVDMLVRQLPREGTAILLVGPSGVGKTAIVHEVVRRLAARALPIQERQEVWQVDGNRIIAGMSVVGAWERRLRAMVDELSLRQDILYVPDLPSLVYTGRSAHSDTNVAQYLEPLLSRGELRILGECTPERLAAVRDEAPGFFARFRVIQVPELDDSETWQVLVQMARAMEQQTEARCAPDALEKVVSLGRRFLANQPEPGRSVRLLQWVSLSGTSEVRDRLMRPLVRASEVVEAFGNATGLPASVLTLARAHDHPTVKNYFEDAVVAQPAAAEAAADVVLLLEQGLNDPGRPLSTFLFVGPTGVGKTETAKALGRFLFRSEDRIVRFDMSEFMTSDSVVRLFGDRLRPDGELTRRVEQQPFSVVLLDEIEKAHPSVFDALLQVLGEGRLTNAAGRTTSFTSTIIIMTSNLGVGEANRFLGFGERGVVGTQAHFQEAARRFFRPEFYNRIDRVVPFDPLGREAIVPLVKRLLQQILQRQGLVGTGVLVEVDPALVDLLVDEGFDRRYGARSVKRILERRLAVPLAEQLLARDDRALTFAYVYPDAGKVALRLQRPHFPERRRLPDTERPKAWSQVAARHQAVLATFEQVSQDPRVEHARYLRLSALAEGDGVAEATALALLDELDLLGKELGSFEDQYLEVQQYEERREKEPLPLDASWFKAGPQTRFAQIVRPARFQRANVTPSLVGSLEQLEQRLAKIWLLLQVMTEDPGRRWFLWVRRDDRPVSGGYLRTLAQAWHATWAALGPVRVVGRWPQGWAPITVGADNLLELTNYRLANEAMFTEQVDALCFELRSASVLLARQELGLHAIQEPTGAVSLLELVEADATDLEPEPTALLAKWHEAQKEQREALVAPPSVRRVYGPPDPETGINTTLEDENDCAAFVSRMVALRWLCTRGAP